jgi:hypothetical protein
VRLTQSVVANGRNAAFTLNSITQVTADNGVATFSAVAINVTGT